MAHKIRRNYYCNCRCFGKLDTVAIACYTAAQYCTVEGIIYDLVEEIWQQFSANTTPQTKNTPQHPPTVPCTPDGHTPTPTYPQAGQPPSRRPIQRPTHPS